MRSAVRQRTFSRNSAKSAPARILSKVSARALSADSAIQSTPARIIRDAVAPSSKEPLVRKPALHPAPLAWEI